MEILKCKSAAKEETKDSMYSIDSTNKDLKLNINPMDRITPKQDPIDRDNNAEKLLKLADQISDSRDQLIFKAKITSKILKKHTRAC